MAASSRDLVVDVRLGSGEMGSWSKHVPRIGLLYLLFGWVPTPHVRSFGVSPLWRHWKQGGSRRRSLRIEITRKSQATHLTHTSNRWVAVGRESPEGFQAGNLERKR